MNAAEGTRIAFANDQFEIHIADDDSSALVVYPLSEMEDPMHDRVSLMLAGMGFAHVDECGWMEIPESETGLTGTLEWDRCFQAPTPSSVRV